jgi:hypothetical protein
MTFNVFVVIAHHEISGTDEGVDTSVIGVYMTNEVAEIFADQHKEMCGTCIDTEIEEFEVK